MTTQTGEQQDTVTISVVDLEAIIERALRNAVREELCRLFHQHLPRPFVTALPLEGADDPAGDEQRLQEALEALAYSNAHPETVTRPIKMVQPASLWMITKGGTVCTNTARIPFCFDLSDSAYQAQYHCPECYTRRFRSIQGWHSTLKRDCHRLFRDHDSQKR